MKSPGDSRRRFPNSDARFPATGSKLWSDLLDEGGEGFSALYQAYSNPIYAFLRHRRHSPKDAEDLTQSFFMHLLVKETLKRADRGKGRLRSFLLGVLEDFVADEKDKADAQKRGGRQPHVPTDADPTDDTPGAELGITVNPADIFDYRWAVTLLKRTHERLTADYVARNRLAVFERLQVFLEQRTAEETYDEVGRPLGMTGNAVKAEVSRMRAAFRACLGEEMALTVNGPAEVEDELRYLFKVLQDWGSRNQPGFPAGGIPV